MFQNETDFSTQYLFVLMQLVQIKVFGLSSLHLRHGRLYLSALLLERSDLASFFYLPLHHILLASDLLGQVLSGFRYLTFNSGYTNGHFCKPGGLSDSTL